jgi:hypothetical protein
MLSRRFAAVLTIVLTAMLTVATAQSPQPKAPLKATVRPVATGATIQTADLKRFLTDLSSDDMEGRGNGQEGLALSAAYIAGELKALHVPPGGDHGSYVQSVKLNGVNTTSRSSVTIEVNGQSRTFKDGEAITFPKKAGGKQTLTFDEVQFVGYGLDAPDIRHNDYEDKNVRGKLVVWLGGNGPKGLDPRTSRRSLSGRNRYATESAGAGGVIGPEIVRTITPEMQAAMAAAGLQPPGQQGQAAGRAGQPAGAGQPAAAGRGGQQPAGMGSGRGSTPPPSDFTTPERLDKRITPAVTVKAAEAGDAFFDALFASAPTRYAELEAKAAAGEPLPTFTITGVKVTINVDMTYDIVSTQRTRNVVAVIPGSDPKLKDSYVVFGAHYDHLGYQLAAPQPRPAGAGQGRQGPAPTTVEHGHERRTPDPSDRIYNGADDDGSGSAALLALAKAFMNGPKPKRSLMFVWFCGEERGLWGSQFAADFGPAPDKVAAELNIDMIGRNEWDNPKQANTVFIIGSDRISTELHNLNVDANSGMAKPLALDYTFNDPADTNQFYFRSDHYSYASKGTPIVFYTTGEHRDYHQLTDEVQYIEWEKYTRIVQLIYDTGRRVANLDHVPVRDNKGPRAGKGTTGKITTN